MIAITQQIDLSGPVGNLIASLLFGIAEIELQHAKERQAAGIAVAKKRGVYTGRRQGTNKAAPARVLRRQGLTVLEIAQALGVKERTVYHYLSNGRYTSLVQDGHAQRVKAVLALFRGEPGAVVSAQYRIGRSTLYKFRSRALAAIRDALADRRRGPRQAHNRVSAETLRHR